jgi:predicted GNAT family N-acyltransferase
MATPVVLAESPSAAEFIGLRRLMGSPEVDEESATKTTKNAVFSVCLRDRGRLLGLARVVGDGVLYFYISDVVVHPELRGSGYGVVLMNAVMEYLKSAARPGAMVVVVPLKDRESFYERFGFRRCPDGQFGTGMYLPPIIGEADRPE